MYLYIYIYIYIYIYTCLTLYDLWIRGITGDNLLQTDMFFILFSSGFCNDNQLTPEFLRSYKEGTFLEQTLVQN